MWHVQSPSHLGRYWWWNNILCASSPATPMWSTCIFLGSEMFTIQETRTLSRRIRRNKECCRWDNGPMCKSPISTGFGPQNITVITSQESHYWNAFLIGFTKTHFIHPPNYGYWDGSFIWKSMQRIQESRVNIRLTLISFISFLPHIGFWSNLGPMESCFQGESNAT